MSDDSAYSRRRFLGLIGTGAMGLAASGLYVPGAFAQALVETPRQTEGPFYPDRLPLDTDNDLVTLGDTLTPAIGEVTHLSGRVLDRRGAPLRNVTVEIWQVDNHGAYLHSRTNHASRRDVNFQASDGSRRPRPASIASGPSSRSPTRDARRTFM